MAEILGVFAGYELVRYFVVRRARAWMHSGAVRFVREHRIRLESARFIDRVWIRESLAQDPDIETKIADLSRATKEPVRALRARVDKYVDEIAPFFSLSVYYRFGASLGRRVVDFCFELIFDPAEFHAQAAKADPEAVRVYVINHRANMDPLVLAYALLRHVPMSYAVGEWALVWPLHWLFRAFGSYFVRRGEKDPLYHAVLERFVQLIASEGAVTGFFIEGGLSRDGALRRPRTGLMDYIIGLRRQHPEKAIVFMPVGLNYDRVFEDRILLRDKDGPAPKPTLMDRLGNLAGLVFWFPVLAVVSVLRVATRSHRKFGYAAVKFGEPLPLADWPGGNELHDLPDDARKPALEALGEELLSRRVARVVPATPVPILCTALLRPGPSDAAAVQKRIAAILAELHAVGAPVALGRAFDSILHRRRTDEGATQMPGLDDAILDSEEAEQIWLLASGSLVRRRVLRRVVTPTGKGVEAVPEAAAILTYYANSIRHHLNRGSDACAP